MTDITISLLTTGSGKIESSGGTNPLAVRNSITVPYGFTIYVHAIPDPGYKFSKWIGNGQESVQNPMNVIAIQNGNITAVFVPDISSSGFIISADKVQGQTGFMAVVSISYPQKANSKVNLMKRTGSETGVCVVNDIQLDSFGRATVQYQITDNHQLFAVEGFGCCAFLGPQCVTSNTLYFNTGTNWEQIAIYGSLFLGGLFVISQFARRN